MNETRIDYAFILAAGLGTRMGELGKHIPKPLWPVFEKTLLELQLEYVKFLGIKKVFINTHHLAEQVREKIRQLERDDVVISHEPEILDIGGGIHRVAESVDYKGNMLVLNCDQFLWLTKENLVSMLELLTDKNYVVMTSIRVNPKMGYNGIKIIDSSFQGLMMGDDLKNLKSVDTYGGVCIIDLARLPRKTGKSKYFESIVDLKDPHASVWNAGKNEYWDFGTSYRFSLSHWELISDFQLGVQGEFLSFLVNTGALKLEKIKSTGYGTTREDTLELQQMIVRRSANNEWEIAWR
jgi:choline kinase